MPRKMSKITEHYKKIKAVYKVFSFMLLFVLLFCAGYITKDLRHDLRVDNNIKTLNDLSYNIWMLTGKVNGMESELKEKFKVKKKFQVTGYSNDPISINVPKWRDGLTATGVPVKEGHCASSWDILPVETRVWVPNFGWCEVQDTGSAMRRDKTHIDLFFDTYEKALMWGNKYYDIVVVYPETDNSGNISKKF